MLNLVKTKAKERTKSRALAGMGIGAAASLLIQGLRGNLNDGKSFWQSAAIGAAIGGFIGGSIKKAGANTYEPENIEKRIAGKGVVFVHCATDSKSDSTYEDISYTNRTYSYGFQYTTVQKAFEIAQKTKSVQEYFNLFDDKKNAF